MNSNLLEWVNKLEAYAKKQGLSRRILDDLEECKEHAASQDIEWKELKSMLEEVMESIRLKTGQNASVTVYHQDEQAITVEDVEIEIKKMVERCHEENTASIAAIANKKDNTITGCIRKMSDISMTKAHVNELRDQNMYMNFFYNIGDSYEKEMGKATGELIADINGNYENMMKHMKSMFHSIKSYADNGEDGHGTGVGSEKFYREYESVRDGLEYKLVEEAKTADYGNGWIKEFAQRTRNNVDTIIKKLKHKMIISMCIPLLVVIVIFAGASFLYSQNPMVKEAAALQESGDEKLDELGSFGKWTSGGIEKFAGVFAKGLVSPVLKKIYRVIMAIMAAAYLWYLYSRKKRCDRQICDDCCEYLKHELNQFEQSGLLRKTADEATEHIVTECEQQYMNILMRIFKDTKYDQKESENVSEFQALQKEWEQLTGC